VSSEYVNNKFLIFRRSL